MTSAANVLGGSLRMLGASDAWRRQRPREHPFAHVAWDLSLAWDRSRDLSDPRPDALAFGHARARPARPRARRRRLGAAEKETKAAPRRAPTSARSGRCSSATSGHARQRPTPRLRGHGPRVLDGDRGLRDTCSGLRRRPDQGGPGYTLHDDLGAGSQRPRFDRRTGSRATARATATSAGARERRSLSRRRRG